jgi:hypothetical protein
VTTFFIFGGGDNIGQGLAITTASVVSSDVVESVSIVITGGETTRTFFPFFEGATCGTKRFFLNSVALSLTSLVLYPLKAKPTGFGGFILTITIKEMRIKYNN